VATERSPVILCRITATFGWFTDVQHDLFVHPLPLENPQITSLVDTMQDKSPVGRASHAQYLSDSGTHRLFCSAKGAAGRCLCLKTDASQLNAVRQPCASGALRTKVPTLFKWRIIRRSKGPMQGFDARRFPRLFCTSYHRHQPTYPTSSHGLATHMNVQTVHQPLQHKIESAFHCVKL
jgi:hypothetical protein